MNEQNPTIKKAIKQEYQYGFTSPIQSDTLAPGLDENTIKVISSKKNEPQSMLEWRLQAFELWKSMEEPDWGNIQFPVPIHFQDISYFSTPKSMENAPKSLDEVDPKLLEIYDKLGVPLHERAQLAGVAVDAVFDSVSVATTLKKDLEKVGVIFCAISEAIQTHPELIAKYLGSVVPPKDNFFAALNAAVFTDGSFCYIPEGVRCPVELSTYFRINALNTGQFERTLIIADKNSYVSYLEGCSAPMRDENQLHAAVVELIALEGAEIKYSTVQNWYPGDAEGKGGIYNLVTKRGLCQGAHSTISWTQIETGSAITWKYPSVILQGDHSSGSFYSVALTRHHQQADTGTKMIHIGKNTSSTIISKGISAGKSRNTYRGQVKITPKATSAQNYTQCDSMIIGSQASAFTFPYITSDNSTAIIEHEATTSKIRDDQLFYLGQRGIDPEQAVSLIINGFCKDVFQKLPLEFAAEANALIEISLEGAIA